MAILAISWMYDKEVFDLESLHTQLLHLSQIISDQTVLPYNF